MKTLVVATANTPPHSSREIAADRSHRFDYVELARRLGCDYIDYGVLEPSPIVRRIEEKARLDIRLSRHVAKLVRREGYECVFSMSERLGIPLTHQLGRNVKHIVLVHHALSSAKLSMLRLVKAAQRWDGIIAVSPAEAAALAQALGLPEGAVHSLIAAVDTDFYRPPDREPPLSARDHFQSLGSSHRDYPTLLRALRKLPEACCELRLGSSWVRNGIHFQGQEIPSNVRIKGFIQPPQLREWYGLARFAVIPLLEDTQWSAGCTSVQHAQAMGRAVIATDRPGLRSYLVDGETGILVRPNDEKDLAEAIDYLWRNPGRADRMGRRGREFVAGTASFEHWLEAVARILGHTVAAQRPSPPHTMGVEYRA